MRVLHVIDSLGPGGAELSLSEMLPGLRARGVTSTVACFSHQPGGVHDRVVAEGTNVQVIGARSTFGRARAVRRLLRADRFDLIHTTLYGSDVIGRLAALGTATPVLTSVVNTSYEPERLVHDPNLRISRLRAAQLVDAVTARRTTHFHTITEAVKTSAVRHLHVRPSRVSVIYRGRDTARLGVASAERRAEVRAREGIPSDRVVLLTAGRQEFQKGHVFLLDAMATLTAAGDPPLLLLAGRPGNATGAIEDRLRAHPELADHVRLLGQRPDVPDLMAAADVFVLPSIYEGAAGVLLEALHLQVPIVATALPSLEEALFGAAAALVPLGDAVTLAQALEEVIADEPRRTAAATAGRRRFDETFVLDRSVEAMHSLYRRLVTASDH